MIEFQPINTATKQECESAANHPDNKKAYLTGDYIERIRTVNTVPDFQAFASKIRLDFGYSVFGGGIVLKEDNRDPVVKYMCDGHTEWVKHYRKNLITVDPLLIQLRNKLTPLILKTSDYLPALKALSPHMAQSLIDFNIDGFVAVPLHARNSTTTAIRFAYSYQDKLSDKDIEHSLPLLTMISAYMHEALCRILHKKKNCSREIGLSKREAEILSWVAGGKSTWAISEILKISENTVLSHMKRIHAKLGVNTRQHAVAKAISSNLIHL